MPSGVSESPRTPKARKELTLADKVKLIRESEATKKGVRALAEQFNCGKTQVSTILKHKLEYLTAFDENGPKDYQQTIWNISEKPRKSYSNMLSM